jgi:hypothetical protein
MQKLESESYSLIWKRFMFVDSIVVKLFFLMILISIPTVSIAKELLFYGKWTPKTVSILSFSSSYIFKKSWIYLLWVKGNLAKGKIGELNFITYIFCKIPPCYFLSSFFLVEVFFVLGTSSVSDYALVVLGFRFFGTTGSWGSSLVEKFLNWIPDSITNL